MGREKSKKKVLIVVTGGIASYKSLDLIRSLIKLNYEVDCILTKSVSQFVAPITFSSLLGKNIFTDLFKLNDSSQMNHINLVSKVNLVVVIPATANFIGKIANGIADDLASTTILATRCPLFVAPAMNTGMYENKAVKSNLKILKKRNIKILEPKHGKLACGQVGKGKLMDIDLISENIVQFFNRSTLLKGKKAVVTSGPSQEKIDPVRYISNFSSGIQGYELAKALRNAGARTTLISGPTKLDQPLGMKFKKAETGKEFLNHSLTELPADIYISVAAIADWKIENISKQKIKKNKQSNITLKFSKNTDVLYEVSKNNKRPSLVIGFAAETENLVENAKKKLLKKKCDWIIANIVSDKLGFDEIDNKVTIVKEDMIIEWPSLSKLNIAEKLVLEISEYFSKVKKEFLCQK